MAAACLPGFTNATDSPDLTDEGLAIKGIGDLNHDGFPDLLVLEEKKPEIYLNDGHGKFSKKAGAMIVNSQSAHSYYSYAQTERHFGLGERKAADVNVQFYPSGKRVEKKTVPANSIIVVSE